ncbi:Erythromycin esterase [Seminavis robusta]|uniref:Erythromycin esterase n=1 Tax=Seminavis robusta TaxID=568900 RepID=A0A9N8E9B7_9STRA|nr:Erythromycin esterase [Seminavis robusta]|eukprot:Sro692_g187980.1 Erythromycin esterase (492) ;mRNA; f:5794-7269
MGSVSRIAFYLVLLTKPQSHHCIGRNFAFTSLRPSYRRQRFLATRANAAEEKFLRWAQANLIPIPTINPHEDIHDDSDLKKIATVIGDGTQVVAISEGCHNSREMLTLCHKMVRLLVEFGFNTIISETAFPEARLIFDYVQGKYSPTTKEEKEEMYRQGLNQMYSQWVEGRDLIEWMREYNQDHDNILHYYGSDIGGFYKDWKTPFQRIFDYLNTVDEAFASTLHSELKPYLDRMGQNARLVYQFELSRFEQCELEAILDNALHEMDSNREEYVNAASGNDFEYEWARQSLESMRLAEHYYRNYAQRCDPDTSKLGGLNGREMAMYRNVLWALKERQKRQDHPIKAIIIHHVIHTKTECQYQDKTWGFFTPAGHMLKESLGEKLYVIGMAYGGGNYWKEWQKGPDVRSIARIPPASPDGLEEFMELIPQSGQCYFLPWKEGPSETKPWLSTLYSMRENDYFVKIVPREWDACFYFKSVQPATAPSGDEGKD